MVGEKKNDGTGDITFDTIDFDQDDIGKTYTYTITELDDAKQGYTYDAHTETVKVKVEDAGGGKLNVVTEYDADGAQFENNYAPNVGFAILKHDENDQPLGGAKFTLYLDDGDNKFTSMDSPATIYEDQYCFTKYLRGKRSAKTKVFLFPSLTILLNLPSRSLSEAMYLSALVL